MKLDCRFIFEIGWIFICNLEQAQQTNDILLSQLQQLDEAKQARSWFCWFDKSIFSQPHQHFATKAKSND